MIIFEGRFSERMIEEIKKKIGKKVNLIVASTLPKDQEENEVVTLSSGEIIYIYENINGASSNKTLQKFSVPQIKKLVSVLMNKKYGFVPEFKVKIDAFMWLPVAISFFDDTEEWVDVEEEIEKKGEDFQKFWKDFQQDMDKIRNKHNGGEFEYGDKLLQNYFGKEIQGYDLIGASKGGDTIFTETCGYGGIVVHIDECLNSTLNS